MVDILAVALEGQSDTGILNIGVTGVVENADIGRADILDELRCRGRRVEQVALKPVRNSSERVIPLASA